jgi:hypothetical protein
LENKGCGFAVDYCPAPALYAICAGRESHKRQRGVRDAHRSERGQPGNGHTEHMKTYGLFCKLTAYTIIGVVAVMVILALFVA